MINNRMNRARQAFYNGGDGNMNGTPPQMSSNNIKAIQKRLQKISFALVEVVLYLDAYPNNEKAKKYYKELSEERDMLLKALEKAGMPMSATNVNVNGGEWSWVKGPWPWEYEANV